MAEDRPNWNLLSPNPSHTMPPLPQAPCVKCGKTIDTAFQYCPYCGKSQQQGSAWYYHPMWILLLALFVIGPFALPLVWKSSRMNSSEKALMAVVILANTIFVLYFTYWLMGFFMKFLNDLRDVMEQIHLR